MLPTHASWEEKGSKKKKKKKKKKTHFYWLLWSKINEQFVDRFSALFIGRR